jgi:DNA-binding IclR family transcriptional regulator
VDRGQVILAPYRIGETLPLHVGAAPMLLLAAMDDESVAAYLATPLERMTPETVITPSVIRRRLARIRAEGHVIAQPDDIAIGLSAVGAPITGPNGLTLGALSLSGLTAHIAGAEEQLIKQVRASADAIGRLLASSAAGVG